MFKQPLIVDGKKVVSSSNVDYVDDIRKCEDLVIGVFVGQRISFMQETNIVTRVWKPKGSKRNRDVVDKDLMVEGSDTSIGGSEPSLMDSVEQVAHVCENLKEKTQEKTASGRVIQTPNMFELLVEHDLNWSGGCGGVGEQWRWKTHYGIMDSDSRSCFGSKSGGGNYWRTTVAGEV
ncbi:hypothetical protein C5167_033867 [Papaver somniferum]|uniref:Uncharacterized protein n=1 Tax=Papaver somniferum TaxID=3469 RepID=A0A4Y7KBF0_PAPSO|nr:hypothetical protein C5167_033867 [Papaver somniferum]